MLLLFADIFSMLRNEKFQNRAEANSAITKSLEPRWLRPAAAAKYAGMSRPRLYQLLQDGSLPSCKLGGLRLIDRQKLDALLEGGAK